jgi:hypothetical protein
VSHEVIFHLRLDKYKNPTRLNSRERSLAMTVPSKRILYV